MTSEFWCLAMMPKKKGELEDLMKQIPPAFRPDFIPNNNAQRRDFINQARRAYWNEQHGGRNAQRPHSTRSLCQIPASEVNAWLETLPKTEVT